MSIPRQAAVRTLRQSRQSTLLNRSFWNTAKPAAVDPVVEQQQPPPAAAVPPQASSSSSSSNINSNASTSRASSYDPETHFGFQSVPESQKESLVGSVFSSVASKYGGYHFITGRRGVVLKLMLYYADKMNDAMSFGIHRLWKDTYVAGLNPRGGIKCLDVAGGTGKLQKAFLFSNSNRYAILIFFPLPVLFH